MRMRFVLGDRMTDSSVTPGSFRRACRSLMFCESWILSLPGPSCSSPCGSIKHGTGPAFIKQQAGHYAIRRLCLTLKVHPSGYYAWLSEPKSARAKDDQRLLGLIKHSWLESGGVYGYRKIHDDLREVGESCGRHRVAG